MKVGEYLTSKPNKQRSITDLATYIKTRSQEQPNYTLLLGAGASATSGINTGRDLVDKWRKTFYKPEPSAGLHYDKDAAIQWLTEHEKHWYNPDREYASFFGKMFDLPRQRRVFVENQINKSFPSIGYCYLSKLVEAKYVNTIFTTNFDDLLNEAFSQFSAVRPITCAHDSSVMGISIISARAKIIKLHGDYLYDDIKCTAEDLEKLTQNMEEKLTQFLGEYGLVVSGYSGSDNSIMRILNDIVKKPAFLKSGTYWCLRREDDLGDSLREFLDNDKVYVVVCDGFDELFAELHNEILDENTPIHTSYFYKQNTRLCEEWCNSPNSLKSTNALIKKQLEILKNESQGNVLAQAISGLIRNDSDDSSNKDGLSNDEIIQLLEIQKLRADHNDIKLIEVARSNIKNSKTPEFKTKMLNHCYTAHINLWDYESAKDDCRVMAEMDEHNPNVYLKWANATLDAEKRLELLQVAISKDEYYSIPYEKMAATLIDKLDLGITQKDANKIQDIYELLKRSVELHPAISNPAYRLFFDFVCKYYTVKDIRNELLNKVIKQFQIQDRHSPKTCELIFEYCQKNSTSEFEGADIFTILDTSFQRHYPPNNPGFLSLAVEAALEFDNADFVHSFLNNFDDEDQSEDIEGLVLAKAKIFLEIYKDIDHATEYLLSRCDKLGIANVIGKLIDYAMLSNNTDLARKKFEQHFNKFNAYTQIRIESELLTHEGQYTKSIEVLNKLRSDPYFEEKNMSRIVYNLVLSQNYSLARDTAFSFLSKHGFDPVNFNTIVINYEFSMQKIKEKPTKNERLGIIAATDSDILVRGVAELLLGNTDKAVELLVRQAIKKHSNLLLINSWPIVEPIKARINQAVKHRPPQLKQVG